ncbi:hypothetical protein ACLBYG_18035 [Methylobacterium sp. D53M]|jgi:hypothetical protein
MAQEMRWQKREGDGRVHLAYEIPDSGAQSLALTCDTRGGQLSVDYYDDRDRARDGTRAEVEFASEGGTLSLPMRAKQLELDDQIVLQATTTLTQDWVRILSGKTLRVTLSGDTQRIPLAGARTGLAALVAGCSRPSR